MRFKITVTDEDDLPNFLQDYNQKEGTEFRIHEILDYEVTFATLESPSATSEDIFKLAFAYGKYTALYGIH